jgi:hypothetical protein
LVDAESSKANVVFGMASDYKGGNVGVRKAISKVLEPLGTYGTNLT